ncbi:MAG TPA: SRPBCC family protein [Sphingomicrobium sp.]|nr:SRPBCC family protein [Sphingomicrobium sp.]
MDITASRIIAANPGRVASVMFEPVRDPEWIGGANSVDPPSGNPQAIGARTTRHGGFMGRKFSWTTEVTAFEPDRLLDMKFVAGPMKGGSVTYRIEPEGQASRVSIRNSGPGPQIMGWFVRRSVGKDLDRLARLVTA